MRRRAEAAYQSPGTDNHTQSADANTKTPTRSGA